MDLIKISQTEKGMAVDARELHEFLEVGTKFTDWIQERIRKYGFVEEEDFSLMLTKIGERQNVVRHDYNLSLDMAKELCMVENNEKGRQARKYFIECEKRVKRLVPSSKGFLEEKVNIHFSIADRLEKVSGVKKGIAIACALQSIEKETGIDTRGYVKLLPAAEHEVGRMTATELGMQVGGKRAVEINKRLFELGLQYQREFVRLSKKTGKEKTEKEWRLTEEGEKYAEEFPYNRNGHSGYQIKWSKSVLPLLNAKKDEKAK
ncbi:antA/AntB antirepressor family protein [Brevibacillus laterosporus]|uniref:antA/AntB antirepressor family protein n=1 Tax=Brevibacillus laterosporus TaxID=1465 RepID=UPI003D24EDCC